MAHDVFISYALDDKTIADAVCAKLEAKRIRCWIAPRDVLPGMDYAQALVEAINQSRVMVLIFSARSNHSPHVRREVERAVNAGIPILPFRIEDVPLSPSLEYFIGTVHWLDALTPPLGRHLERLAETVHLMLFRERPGEGLSTEASVGEDPSLAQQIEPEADLIEDLAEAAHEIFCESRIRDGWKLGPRNDAEKTHPLLVPYADLPETHKEANRVNVRNIIKKLAVVEYAMIPSRSSEPPLEFPPDDLETLARLEHELWMEDRFAAGFALGVPTDEDLRRNPYLVESEEVPEEIKNTDRDLVRGIPQIAARAGYAIVKAPQGSQRATESPGRPGVLPDDTAMAAPPSMVGGTGRGRDGWARGPVTRLHRLETEPVHFSVTSPPTVHPGDHFVMDVWAHLHHQREAVLERAKEAFGAGAHVQSKGPVLVVGGTLISVHLTIEGFTIGHPEDSIQWLGEPANASFPVTVPNDASEGPRDGLARIYIHTLQIARIPFVVLVSKTLKDDVSISPEGWPLRKAFASYASDDREEVLGRVQGMQKVAPQLEVFLDVLRLRSGEDWAKRLCEVIPEHDVFYLFWSSHAKQSIWVKREWRCTLRARGLDFIDPVPLVSPEDVPPPRALASKHFNDWTLAFKRGERQA